MGSLYRDILEAEVVTRETNFTPNRALVNEYSKMLSGLTRNAERNRLISSDVACEAKSNGGISLVLSDRRDHCECASRASDRAIRLRC